MKLSFRKNIFKTILFLIYTGIIMLVVFGLSSVFAYLNTGADRNLMLYHKIHETVHYQPNITWKTNHNQGRFMDKNTLKNIEKDYLNAWYVKQIAFQKNTDKGLKDYYTKNPLKSLFSAIKTNTKNNTSIEATSLTHHPSVDFFSEDGQLVMITDSHVKEHKRIYSGKNLVLEVDEINTYQILLLLEDGFWRIRQLLKTASTQNIQQNIVNIDFHKKIKGINYYPQKNPWNMFGNDFNASTIQNDFKLIKNTGLNTIRIFVPYVDFGASEVKKTKLNKLNQVLNIAKKHHLNVIVTLFDFYGNYDVLDWTLNNKHATTVVNSFKDHPALLAWDVKNEPNLDFKSRGKQNVLAWLQQMIYLIKYLDPKHPVTIGWSDVTSATLLKDKVDFVSFHYYEDLELLAKAYQKLKKEIPKKEIVLGEYGISSYKGIWNIFGQSEKKQAAYHKKIQDIAHQNNIPFVSWTLYDFDKIPKEVVGRLPWRKNNQKHFGFIHQNGTPKKSFKYIAKP